MPRRVSSSYRGSGPPRLPVLAGAGLLVGVIAGVAWLIMFIGGWKSVPVDKIALHYTGGPLEGQHFEKVVAPGTSARFYGLLDRVYQLPATQRNYIMSKNPGEGDRRRPEFVGAPTRDNVVTEWESATYFKLNTHGPVARQFLEQMCLKYRCTDLSPGGGWDSMLADTFRQQIVAAIQAEARRYSAEEIYSNREVLLRIQSEVGSSLKGRVNDVLGGEFFCGPTYTAERPSVCPDFTFVIKEVALPKDLREQYHVNRAAALGVDRAKSEAAQKRIEAEGEAAKQNALRAASELTPAQLAYIRAQAELECARRPECVLVAGSTAGGVLVAPQPNRNPR